MSASKKLTLFIPGLNSTQLSEKLLNQIADIGGSSFENNSLQSYSLQSKSFQNKSSDSNNSELSAFNSLFSKSKVCKITSLDTISRYFDLFQLLTSNQKHNSFVQLPISSIFFSNLNKDIRSQINTKNRWLYNITPVYLYPDMDQLLLRDDLTEHVRDDEAKEICQKINQLFNKSERDNCWEIVYFAKYQWFIISDFKLINQAMPVDMIAKPLVIPKFSTTEHHSRQAQDNFNYWVQTLNEIQMLLFSLTRSKQYSMNQKNKNQENQNQQSQSHFQCNSLWLWGESFLSGGNKKISQNSWDRVYSDNYLVQQLCLYSEYDYQPTFCVQDILVSEAQTVLIVLNDLEHLIKSKDLYAIIEALNHYEQQWFIPLKKAILSGSLSVRILTNGEQSFLITKASLKSWCKRTKKTGAILESLF